MPISQHLCCDSNGPCMPVLYKVLVQLQYYTMFCNRFLCFMEHDRVLVLLVLSIPSSSSKRNAIAQCGLCVLHSPCYQGCFFFTRVLHLFNAHYQNTKKSDSRHQQPCLQYGQNHTSRIIPVVLVWSKNVLFMKVSCSFSNLQLLVWSMRRLG